MDWEIQLSSSAINAIMMRHAKFSDVQRLEGQECIHRGSIFSVESQRLTDLLCKTTVRRTFYSKKSICKGIRESKYNSEET